MRHTILLSIFFFGITFSASATDYMSLLDRKIFIENYTEIAVREMHRTGIPASIKLAQFILESSWGKSELFLKANACFGVKANGSTGPLYACKDDDYDADGNLIYSDFRMYQTTDDSFIDHSNYLINRGLYDDLFDLGRYDYRGWAIGLKRCGYATNPRYAEKLIELIEEYNLNYYDLLPNAEGHTVQPNIPAQVYPQSVTVRPAAVPQPPAVTESNAPKYRIIAPVTAPQARKTQRSTRRYRPTSYQPMRMF